MDEYIKRERLLRDPYFQEDRYPESHLLRMAIMNQPAADVAPVVRCKDCRWLYDQADDYCCFNHKVLMKITPDSYCSYGEREEGGTYDPATMH